MCQLGYFDFYVNNNNKYNGLFIIVVFDDAGIWIKMHYMGAISGICAPKKCRK